MDTDPGANNSNEFVVGDGTSAAFYDMSPGDTGYHTFGSPGLIVNTGASLRGSGTLTGTLTVFGTFVPGFANSVGSIFSSNSLSFGSSSVLNYDLGTSSDSVTVNGNLAINNLVSLMLDTHSDKEGLDRAISLAEKLKSSTVPQFQDTYGWALFKRGDTKNAVASLEAVAAKLPNLAAVHYHLGMSYAATGQAEKAKDQLNKAFSLEPDGTPLKESIRSAMK